MRAVRIEEAGAPARQIRGDITRRIKRQLEQIDGTSDAKELWKAVRQLTGRENAPANYNQQCQSVSFFWHISRSIQTFCHQASAEKIQS